MLQVVRWLRLKVFITKCSVREKIQSRGSAGIYKRCNKGRAPSAKLARSEKMSCIWSVLGRSKRLCAVRILETLVVVDGCDTTVN